MTYKIDWPHRGHGFTDLEIDAVVKIMRESGSALTQGKHVKKFELDFTSFLHGRQAFSTMSCAHALDIAAMLLNIQEGDEVLIPAHTYCATALAFARRGAKIVWVDINPESLTISLAELTKSITPNTKAVVIVHLYGLIAPEIVEIANLCKAKNISLIEDCAQALGAKLNGRSCGTFGDISCFSFHAQKNLTTLGEGGMISASSDEISEKIPGLRLNGHASFKNQDRYWLPAMTNVDIDIDGIWPIKSTMSEIQGAVGSLVLERLDSLTMQRRKRAKLIREALAAYPELSFQKIYEEEGHSHHLLPLRYLGKASNRDDLIGLLGSKYGVKAIVQYFPLYRYDLFAKMGFGKASVPNTDAFFDNMISLPFSLEISDQDFDFLINSLRQAVEELRA